jgi:outer membrane protein assembly factor BamB
MQTNASALLNLRANFRIQRTGSQVAMAALIAWFGLVTGAEAADWPRWRGPDLNGISRETGWSARWPDAGPKQLWKAAVGIGFSSVSVSEGRVYTMGNRNDTDTVFCFDAESGAVIWKHSYPSPLGDKYYEGGPSVTPTVDGAHLYSLGRQGDVFCFDKASGKILWSKNLATELSAKLPEWGFGGSPLVRGEMVILNVGKAGAALNKKTGKLVWKTGPEASGYATPVPFDFNGKEALAVFGAKAVYAIDPGTGAELWSFPWTTSYDVNAADPIISGTFMFVSSGYQTGGGLIDFKDGTPKLVWSGQEMHNQFNTCVLIDGQLYGTSGQNGRAADLRCVDFMTGQVRWKEPSIGLGSLMAADGKLSVLGEKGELVIAEANPREFKALSRAQILGGRCWTMPVLSNGRIYGRNARGELVCVDVRGGA